MSDLPKIPIELIKAREGVMCFSELDEEMAAMISADTGEQVGACFSLQIPLEPLDTGLDHVPQPESSSFVLEGNDIPIETVDELDGRTFHLGKGPPCNDGSIYIGSAHNPADLKTISFKRIADDLYEIEARIHCQFEYESVGQNEMVLLSAKVRLKKDAV